MANWKNKVLLLRKDARILYFAARHPRTPWYAKAVMALVAVYAISPVDIVHDFIPLAGWLDDLVIIPFGIYIAMRLVPKDIIDEAKQISQSPSNAKKGWGMVKSISLVGFLLVFAFGFVVLMRAIF